MMGAQFYWEGGDRPADKGRKERGRGLLLRGAEEGKGREGTEIEGKGIPQSQGE